MTLQQMAASCCRYLLHCFRGSTIARCSTELHQVCPRRTHSEVKRKGQQLCEVMIWCAHCCADAWLAVLGGGLKRGDELSAGQINHRVGQRCQRFEALQGLPDPYRQPPQRQVRRTCVLPWAQGKLINCLLSSRSSGKLLSPSLGVQAACLQNLSGLLDSRLQRVVRIASLRKTLALSIPVLTGWCIDHERSASKVCGRCHCESVPDLQGRRLWHLIGLKGEV